MRKFCRYCGFKLNGVTEECPRCGRVLETKPINQNQEILQTRIRFSQTGNKGIEKNEDNNGIDVFISEPKENAEPMKEKKNDFFSKAGDL